MASLQAPYTFSTVASSAVTLAQAALIWEATYWTAGVGVRVGWWVERGLARQVKCR